MFWLILGYFILSLLVGLAGKSRNIGFSNAFVYSLIFSPLIAIVFVLFSKRISANTRTE